MSKSDKKGCAIYFSHGGGPLPLLGDESHQAMVDFMKNLPQKVDKPDAVLVVSAHWEEQSPTLLGNAAPPMLYDYYGFPPETYEIDYPAPGNPEMAERVAALLKNAGFSPRMDLERGYDHGLFIPMKIMYPAADIPMLQLSLIRGLDAKTHLELGKALRSLMKENILIIGSGFSFHNMQAFFGGSSGRKDPENDAFQDWLIDTCTGEHSQPKREQLLLEWEKAPYARYCHPREEHLLPLHACFGLTDGPAELIFDDSISGKRAVAFKW